MLVTTPEKFTNQIEVTSTKIYSNLKYLPSVELADTSLAPTQMDFNFS